MFTATNPLARSLPPSWAGALCVIAFAAEAGGCSGVPIGDPESGTTHHLILGFGIVSVSDPKAAPNVSAVRLHALGLAADTGPAGGLTLGYKSATAVQTSSDADARVEIAPGPFGAMSLTHHGATACTDPEPSPARPHENS